MYNHKIDLMFALPSLEEQFRKLAAVDVEIGGYFICSWWPSPGDLRRWDWLNLFDGDAPKLIRDWFLVPNTSSTPQSQFGTAHLAVARDIVELTNRSRLWPDRGIPVFFHTHPVGSDNTPSPGDISFALKNCLDYQTRQVRQASMIIARSYPLRVNYFRLRYGQETGGDVQIIKGAFHSWRQKRFDKLKFNLKFGEIRAGPVVNDPRRL